MYHEIVLAGVAISLIFSELTGFSPAGLVVPGYIALCLQTPQRVIYTLGVAFVVLGITKGLSYFVILYGRRRFAIMVLLSFAVDFLIGQLRILPADPGMIGVLIPGIIAGEMEKQGIFKSLLSLAVVVGILALLMMWQGIRVFPR